MPDRKRIHSYLVCRSGDAPERIVIWDTLDIRVGRRKTQDIVVADGEVSREHAVLRRDRDRHVVEDLGTGIGTLVNGERITRHELQPGDVIQVGPMELEFGISAQAIRPGENARFASQLKGAAQVPEAVGGGGRTMLGFSAEDSFLSSSAPTTPPPELAAARGLSAEGTLEEVDDDNPLGLSIDGTAAAEYEGSAHLLPPLRTEGATGASTVEQPPALELVLEVEGATPELKSLLTALNCKLIGLPSLKIGIKKGAP